MSYYVKGMGAALIAECNQERLTFRGGTGLLVCQLRDTLKFADAAEARIRALEAELKLQDQANDIMTHLLRKISRDYDRPGDWMPELQGALRSALETKVCICGATKAPDPSWHSSDCPCYEANRGVAK